MFLRSPCENVRTFSHGERTLVEFCTNAEYKNARDNNYHRRLYIYLDF